MCWTRWKHQILMNWLSLYLFRPPVLQLINYLWAFSLQNLPQIWSKFWWSISMIMIYIMEKNPHVNLSWSWIISNSIIMPPKGYWYLNGFLNSPKDEIFTLWCWNLERLWHIPLVKLSEKIFWKRQTFSSETCVAVR